VTGLEVKKEKNCTLSTRERLLKAASKLFAERGFAGVSTREIARVAKVNPAAIHYHFGSKKGLYIAVVKKIFLAHASKIKKEFEQRVKRCNKSPECVITTFAEAVLLSDLSEDERNAVFSFLVREVLQPSEAYSIIVEDGVLPIFKSFVKSLIDSGCKPGEALTMYALSVFSQVVFFNFFANLVKKATSFTDYDESTKAKVITHIARFSVNGLKESYEEG